MHAAGERRSAGRAARLTRTIPKTLMSRTFQPLVVQVVLDGPLGADAGVIDQDIEAA